MTRELMDPAAFIAEAPWRFAKTMPQNPHEYTVRGQTPIEDFEAFVRYIRQHGYKAKYGRTAYVYLNVDRWKYWTMGARVESTIIINRASLDLPGERREADPDVGEEA